MNMKNTKNKFVILAVSICLFLGILFLVYYFTISNKPFECDEIIEIPQSNKPEDFETMLTGVKYALIADDWEEINEHTDWGIAFDALSEYLYEIGFENVGYNGYYNPKNLCECIYVNLYFSLNQYAFYDISMTFYSNAGHLRQFSTNKIANRIYYSSNSTKENLKQAFRDMYGDKKAAYDSIYTMQLAKKQTCWTEEKLKNIMQKKGYGEIEGIYESFERKVSTPKYRVAVKNIKDIYYLIYLSGADNTGDWAEGEIKATLEPTATPKFFKAYWLMADKSENDNYYLTFEENGFNLKTGRDTTFYIKMFPTARNRKR